MSNRIFTSAELAKLSWNESEATCAFINSAFEATRQVESLRQSLDEKLQYLQRQLNEATAMLAQGRCPNSLGVCQSQGIDVDRLCGELAQMTKIAHQIQRDAQKAGILPTE